MITEIEELMCKTGVRAEAITDEVDGEFLGGHTIDSEELLMILREATKAQELKAKIEELEGMYNSKNSDFLREKGMREHTFKANQRYKEALEFYGNEINYQVFIRNGKSNIERDDGEKARQALKGESE